MVYWLWITDVLFMQSIYSRREVRGFTLIELLVVISIIGVLSSFATISLNDARAKSRDAKRLNDVRQMANALAVEATQGVGVASLESKQNVLCGSATAVTDPRNCAGPGIVGQFERFTDPSNATSLCAGTSDQTCQYALAEGSTNVQNAQIYFFLEQDVAGLGAGLHVITPEGEIIDLD